MVLIFKKIKNIPKEWEHRPELRNSKGNTVAMLMAYNGTVPPE